MDLERLTALLSGRHFVALTGAGCSTESGIPDYRGAGRPAQSRGPIQHDRFMQRPEVRQRYWARSTLGWPRFANARPNAGHRALAAMEGVGAMAGVITQNVDRLHHAAGSHRTIELHGALVNVRCLACRAVEPRAAVQERLLAANPGWAERAAVLAPDGDAELPDAHVADFKVVGCQACGGALKPDVVFFGGSIAEATLSAAWALFDEAEALLVVGSSLSVYSGYRFVKQAIERRVPIAVLNLGPTRADAAAAVRVEARAAELLPRLAGSLGGPIRALDNQ